MNNKSTIINGILKMISIDGDILQVTKETFFSQLEKKEDEAKMEYYKYLFSSDNEFKSIVDKLVEDRWDEIIELISIETDLNMNETAVFYNILENDYRLYSKMMKTYFTVEKEKINYDKIIKISDHFYKMHSLSTIKEKYNSLLEYKEFWEFLFLILVSLASEQGEKAIKLEHFFIMGLHQDKRKNIDYFIMLYLLIILFHLDISKSIVSYNANGQRVSSNYISIINGLNFEETDVDLLSEYLKYIKEFSSVDFFLSNLENGKGFPQKDLICKAILKIETDVKMLLYYSILFKENAEAEYIYFLKNNLIKKKTAVKKEIVSILNSREDNGEWDPLWDEACTFLSLNIDYEVYIIIDLLKESIKEFLKDTIKICWADLSEEFLEFLIKFIKKEPLEMTFIEIGNLIVKNINDEKLDLFWDNIENIMQKNDLVILMERIVDEIVKNTSIQKLEIINILYGKVSKIMRKNRKSQIADKISDFLIKENFKSGELIILLNSIVENMKQYKNETLLSNIRSLPNASTHVNKDLLMDIMNKLERK
ncbi:hypothetical protein KAI78_09035 [bacterium]|nr:hypothetical protein [bacterium]